MDKDEEMMDSTSLKPAGRQEVIRAYEAELQWLRVKSMSHRRRDDDVAHLRTA
jgi:hypothetical protein